jgi:hypothetical protein
VPAGLDQATLIGIVHGEAPLPGASTPAPAPRHDEPTRRHRIAVEAYLIAEKRGFPPGGEDEHWLEAERRLYGRR